MALFDMVFAGGGAKGSAFVGALEVLAAKGHVTLEALQGLDIPGRARLEGKW